MADAPERGPRTEEILGKADALLARHRASRPALRPEPPIDFPILTEVVTQPPPPTPAVPEEQLAELERDLRLELLSLMGPEFERLIEAKVHERLTAKIDEVLSLTRKVLEAEVRNAVRDALAEVVAAEAARLREGR